MKLSPGAKGLGYLSPGPSSSIPPPLAIAAGLRSSTSPLHSAAGLDDARALCSGRHSISSTSHLDLRACPRRLNTPSTAAYERRRRPPASTPLRSTSTRIELVVSFPTPSSSSPTTFPSLSGAALPGRSCTAAVGVPPPHAHRGQPLCGAARRRRALRSHLASLAAGARRTPAARPCAGRNASAAVPWRARAGAGLGLSLTSGAQLSAPV